MFQGFCVYLHRRKTDSTIFYVGMGRRHRASAGAERNPEWAQEVAAHGFQVQIVHVFDLPIYAGYLERDLIAMLRSQGVALTNRGSGGEGAGMKWSTTVAEGITKTMDVMAEFNRKRAERQAKAEAATQLKAVAKPVEVPPTKGEGRRGIGVLPRLRAPSIRWRTKEAALREAIALAAERRLADYRARKQEKRATPSEKSA